MIDLSFDTPDTSRHAPVRTRQIQEGGKEVLLILDFDSEGEPGEESVALPRDEDDGILHLEILMDLIQRMMIMMMALWR